MATELRIAIQDRLRTLNLTFDSFCEKIGMSEQQINDIMNGVEKLSVDNAIRLQSVFRGTHHLEWYKLGRESYVSRSSATR